jgi:potassium efflux system protein
MLKRLLNPRNLFQIIFCFFLSVTVYAADTQRMNPLFIDHTKLVLEQIELLKNRLTQANNQLITLQTHTENQIPFDQVNTQLLKQVGLEIAVANSNLDSINIEVTEAQQTIGRIQKHIQDLENQLNMLNIFGIKVLISGNTPNITLLQSELDYQDNLLDLENKRLTALQKLQSTAVNILQLNKAKYRHISTLLKSQTMMRLKEEQEKSEINFHKQQAYWLQQLNELYNQLNHVESLKQADKNVVTKLESQIFFANENVNFIYLQMLIARYEDQIQQFRISIARSTSINLLNKVNDQTQLLGKQLLRVDDLLKTRVNILEKRKSFLRQATQENSLSGLENQYKAAQAEVIKLSQQLSAFRGLLDKALQAQLSARQNLPGLNAKAWVDLGEQLFLLPTLAYQMGKSLLTAIYDTFDEMSYQWGALLILLAMAWLASLYFVHRFLKRIISGMADHESGHINLKWLGNKILHRLLIDIAIIVNMYGVFTLCDVPEQNFMFLMNLGFVWLFFRAATTAARLLIVESVHDHPIDVRLYHRVRWILWLGAVVTALSVFVSRLPIVYEVKDLFDRLFLLYVLIISIFMLRSWRVVPDLILPYIDDRHTYLQRAIRLLCLFIPVILLTNSAIGLFGYVNLVLTMSWYESIFLLVTVGYLIVRGLLIDSMEHASYFLIRHVTNGWLWTEAFLKPIDKVLRLVLFLMAWSVLFLLYGWDEQSPVVDRLNKLLHYSLMNVLNTTITPLSVLEVIVIISLLFWAARWTREFVYRFLMSRTKDMGLRNSIAILSQYMTVVIGVLVCLRVLGIDLRALTVVAGAFFFGVGLGLRDLFNNFACGFLLLIERPIRVGDTVTINNCEGEVLHIGSRAVTIRTYDHTEFMVPNAEIFSKSFINWTAKDNIVRAVFCIKVNRHDNPHDIQKIIYSVLAAHKDVLKDPAPEVFLKAMEDDVEFEIRYYLNIRHVKSRVGLRSEIIAGIWDEFEKHNIQPPYPRREIFMKA